MHQLQQIEPGVADDGRNDGAAAQIHDAPERAKNAGRDCGIRALNQMAGPERGARDDDADHTAAKRLLEAAQQERALNFLTHSAGDDVV